MILHQPESLKRLLKKRGLWTDKGLGQHFLVSESAVNKIVDAASACVGVLEIGPGPGVLTRPLSERVAKVVALELDTKYVRLLAETAPSAEVVQGDALDADLAAILETLPRPRAIVSNLPYYITSPLLQRFAAVGKEIDLAVLMMQKEVALRIAARPGHADRGSLSVFLQAHFDMRAVCDVPAASFLPPPKVDSRVLALTPTGTETPESVFRTVRLGFAQPRKTLANNLSVGYHMDRDPILDMLESRGMNEKIRAQELTLDQWQSLSEALES